MSARTDLVVRLRLEYDADHSKAGAWLDAENDLTHAEFDVYMADYRAAVSPTTPDLPTTEGVSNG